MKTWFVAFGMALMSGLVHAEALPDGMMFIGLKDGHWRIHVVTDKGLQILETASEPRTATFNRRRGAVAYMGADDKLHEIDIHQGKDRQLLTSDKERALTQPAYSASGQTLYMVAMQGGMSAQTDILAVNLDKKETPRRVTQQPGAQFEPRAMGDHGLLYSSVSCSLGCGRIIQEVWLKDMLTERARQVTLMNAIARQPSPSIGGKWIYFSSDADAHYHIWRISSDGGAAQQITKGNAADISPALDRRSWVYFIRYEPGGTKLMRIDGDGALAALQMPDGITDIRNLEIAP